MKRERLGRRTDWKRRCEEVGFGYHSIGGSYWDESACYAFSAGEVDALEAATDRLHGLCLEACDHLVQRRRFHDFAIPEPFWDTVAHSWRDSEPSLFGRFDLAWDGTGEPKLLEYNADTPTALLEASVVQWYWLQDVHPKFDQFNSLHEKLIGRWGELREALPADATLCFTCVRDNEEDFGNIEYLRDTAVQASLATRQLFIEDLGWSEEDGVFVDPGNLPVEAMFKLYPWEWMVRETFGPKLLARSCRWIEPPWKMLLSNKAILAVLWELFPGHPNLLPCSFAAGDMEGEYVRKPLLSREGANVSLRRKGAALMTGGSYGAEGYVYQRLAPLAHFEDNYAVIGSWVVGDQPAGIGIREDDSPITKNTSRFVPHYFE